MDAGVQRQLQLQSWQLRGDYERNAMQLLEHNWEKCNAMQLLEGNWEKCNAMQLLERNRDSDGWQSVWCGYIQSKDCCNNI